MSTRWSRRSLRAGAVFGALLAAVIVASQFGGVGTRVAPKKPGTKLVFAPANDAWMVQVAPLAQASARSALAEAADDLGGGVTSKQSVGDGWHEVQLDSEVNALAAEAAFGAAGAINVEPVLDRIPYAEVGADDDAPVTPVEDPAPDPEPDAPVTPHDNGGEAPAEDARAIALGATRLAEQWQLDQPAGNDLDALESWKRSLGAGSVVAVIDTGVDATHPDLVGRVLAGKDFSGSVSGAHSDRIGHGTGVASVIAGNGTTIAGVAPLAKILPLKVYRDSVGGFTMSGYVAAIRYAVDAGVDVINISIGCGGSSACYSQAELDALAYASDQGVLVTAAAGNGDNDGVGMNNDALATPDYPSGYELPNIISVTASNKVGARSSWANRGAQSVDLAAPGESILTARAAGGYRLVSGTSYSAPLTAGVAALLVSAHPALEASDLRARMLDGVIESESLSGEVATGGILNAVGALDSVAAASQVSSPRAATPRRGAIVTGRPLLTWQLPAGWSSVKVSIRGSDGVTSTIPVAAAARSASHPASLWRSGLHTWRVYVRTPAGAVVTTPQSAYTVAPVARGWVTAGAIVRRGNLVRLRVGYATNRPSARTRVTLMSGGRVIHRGVWRSRATHVSGPGIPPRGWYRYDARVSRTLRVGMRVTVVVDVDAGGTSSQRRYRARVA